MRIIGTLLLATLLFTACGEKKDHKGKVPLAEVSGKFLYQEDLQSILPLNLSKDDSILFAERYVKGWLENTLLYEKAENNIPDNDKIEQLVSNYRQALITHAYQQELIDQKLSGEITEEELKTYYEANPKLFLVERPLLKGLFIKIPVTATGLNKVRGWYKKNTQEAVDNLEKYSLQNAVSYEYFYDRWVPAVEMIDKIPLKANDPESYLDKNRHLEIKDNSFYYFLNVEEFLKIGEKEPFESAVKKIREILINIKRAEFIQSTKKDLYEQAVKKNQINYFY